MNVEGTNGNQQPPEDEVLDLSYFWPYRWLHCVRANSSIFFSALIAGFLLCIEVLQLLFCTPVLALIVHHSANQHSCISSGKWFFLGASVCLYVITRFVLPVILVFTFSRAVINKLDTKSSSITSDFLKQIQRQENETVIQAVVHKFWDVEIAKKTYHKILRTLREHLAWELVVMMGTAVLEAAVITSLFIQVGATRFAVDAYSVPLGGVFERLIIILDAVSYFLLILKIGIISSFFNHEATVNHLVAGAVALEEHADTFGVKLSKELITSAKDTVNNFNNSWGVAEALVCLSVQLYTLILLLFAAAGLPLSCGTTTHMYVEEMDWYWITFIIFFSIGHFLSTCVWPLHGALMFRSFGIFVEILLLVALWILQPPLFGSFLHILFAVMPAAYLFWYLWIKAHYENSVRSAKPKGWRQQHLIKLAIYVYLMVQLVIAIIVSIHSEFSTLNPSQSNCERSMCMCNTQTACHDQSTF